jgi:2-amino-4-hydroxy-6-hydroxymethyldihydropteridine diphosphokinase
VTLAFVGLGSNLGDRVATLVGAVRALDSLPGTRVLDVSRAYESEPWGITDQPAFANAVVSIETDLAAGDLLSMMQDIERQLGRVSGVRYGPRAIDLDLLLFGSEVCDTPMMVLPHPWLLHRDFVVTPLLEIAPDAALPDGTRVTREHADAGPVVGDLGPLAWRSPRR